MNSGNITIDIEKIDPIKVNDLTEIERGYKLYSTNLADLYNGLHPASLSKIAHVILNCILYNKIYKKQNSDGYSEDESKRIFTNMLIQPSDLAKRMFPVKYSDGSFDIENDLSNIVKKIDELEEHNIFYMWRFKSPYSYIFVMERDVSSWKYYNPKGVVYPKSLKKIVRLAKSMINTMESIEKQRGRNVLRSEIENSFGDFINKLIAKMHPNVILKLTRWEDNVNIFTYISNLLGELKKLNDFEGYAVDKVFVGRLPEHIREKILKTNKEAIIMPLTEIESLDLENDLIPKNQNLVKIKKIKTPREIKRHSRKEDVKIEPETLNVKLSEPFKNPTELLKFYRSFLRLSNSETKFYDFTPEVSVSSEVLDLLIKNNRDGDIKFLKAWIRYYELNHLKGNNIYKQDKTSIKTFKQTFSEYNNKYIA